MSYNYYWIYVRAHIIIQHLVKGITELCLS